MIIHWIEELVLAGPYILHLAKSGRGTVVTPSPKGLDPH